LLLSAAALSITPAPARAADTPPAATETAPDRLAGARELIRQERWRDAITALQQVADKASADWNNLMGYSHRQARTPDFAAAERYYNEALRIDPRHRGALEYSGELYLKLGDLARAEARLEQLGQACRFGCQELSDLRQAVSAYKADRSKPAPRL
jgi:Flp pilus assembly protein TadD